MARLGAGSSVGRYRIDSVVRDDPDSVVYRAEQVELEVAIDVVRGDPSRAISDVENVEIVFKDGKGYDPKKLIDSVKGMVGSR